MARSYGKSGKEDNNKRDGSLGARGLGSAGREGESDGTGFEDGLDPEYRSGIHRNQKSFNNGGEASFGKMLSQLRELQQSHLAYVESHEERLRVRLEAAQQHHQDVMEKMKQIEQEILCLLGETVS
ncbi:hypothetical protein QUA06_28740 [Microcoleus sp. POL8_C6]